MALFVEFSEVSQDFFRATIVSMKHESIAPVRAARDVLKGGSRLFTLSEVSDILCISYERARALFLNGDIPGFSLNAKHAVVMEIELHRYIQAESDAQTMKRKLLATTSVPLQPEIKETHNLKRPLPNLALYERGLPSTKKTASVAGTTPHLTR
jgi:hypothetical protein